MDLCQIHMDDVFGPSLGRVWRSRSRLSGTKKMFFWPFWRLGVVYIW